MEKYYICTENWQKLYKILPLSPKIRVKAEKKTRRFVEAIHFILKTGAQWCELPAYYGKWRSVHKRYESWCRKGVWIDVLDAFSSDRDTEWFMIDATIVRAHPCAAAKEALPRRSMLSLMLWVKLFALH
jgi:transposase